MYTHMDIKIHLLGFEMGLVLVGKDLEVSPNFLFYKYFISSENFVCAHYLSNCIILKKSHGSSVCASQIFWDVLFSTGLQFTRVYTLKENGLLLS